MGWSWRPLAGARQGGRFPFPAHCDIAQGLNFFNQKVAAAPDPVDV